MSDFVGHDFRVGWGGDIEFCRVCGIRANELRNNGKFRDCVKRKEVFFQAVQKNVNTYADIWSDYSFTLDGAKKHADEHHGKPLVWHEWGHNNEEAFSGSDNEIYLIKRIEVKED